MTSSSGIRDAATVILVRDAASAPKVLMGQRGAGAAFMPNKVVFPGGAVEATDNDVALARTPASADQVLLAHQSKCQPSTLYAAGIRELWEETGLFLGQAGRWTSNVPKNWSGFAATGLVPDAYGLKFVARAITPPNRSRRFDARFFLADGDAITGDLDDFSRADAELSQLTWIPVEEARTFDLPFITEVVLAEVAGRLPDLSPPQRVPFFDNTTDVSLFKWLTANA